MSVHPETDRQAQNVSSEVSPEQQSPQSPPQQETPGQAEAEQPTPQAGAESTPGMSDQMQREMDEAMKAATGESPSGPATSEASTSATEPEAESERPKGIRGPRVVEAGREHRHGRLVSIGPDDLFVEFGPKELGVAPRKQWKDEELPAVGTDLEVVIDRFDPNEQLYMCSRPGAVQKAEWEMLQPGQVVEARVTGHNKGGLSLEVAGHRAFMPASLVDVRRIDDLSVFVGEKVRCAVKRVDRSGAGNIVLSRRDIVAEEAKQQRSKLQESLKEGDSVEGTVRKIMDFGAFVDIGGVDGLLHISDLSHDRVKKVEDVVKEGDSLNVKILKLDWGKNRISLGLKQTAPDPWEEAKESLQEGEIVSGRVTKLMEFGAFVEVATGVEGLVHISELSWKRVPKVESVVKPDQVVKVKILEVDPKRKRVSLSVKQTTDPPANMKRGKGDDARSEDEIRKVTPAERRMREKSKGKGDGLKSGLGDAGGLGLGLGNLDLGKFGDQ